MKNLETFEKVLKIAQRTITQISILQPDTLNCVESIIKKIREIKENKQLIKYLNDYLENPNINILPIMSRSFYEGTTGNIYHLILFNF